jgi:hypothetical protein
MPGAITGTCHKRIVPTGIGCAVAARVLIIAPAN